MNKKTIKTNNKREWKIKKDAQKILVNKDETIIVYCSSGSRSKKAQEILQDMGYKHVYNLKKGLDGIDY